MDNPTHKGGYSKADLVNYALHRKNNRLKEIEEDDVPYVYSADKLIMIDLTLSGGGDGDVFCLFYTPEGDLHSGYYYWHDWGVYEEVKLDTQELELVNDALTARYI